MKKVLFLSSLLSNPTFIFNSKGQTSIANDSFQRSIIQGLEQNGLSVDLINVPNIGAYPMRYTYPWIKKNSFKLSEKSRGMSLGFINLPIIKHYVILYKLIAYLAKVDICEYDAIFCYDLYSPFLRILQKIKKVNDIESILIVPDLTGYTGQKKTIISSFRRKKRLQLQAETLPCIDVFVLVAEAMKQKLNIDESKETVVIESIWNEDNKLFDIVDKSKTNRYILYSGSLGARHGILNLIKAFILADLKEVNLIICGDGDARKEVLNYATLNKNIIYKGQIAKSEVLELQSKAYLLVNPRGSTGEFTQYSFPSKVLEYFASGTPTFMYKLQGIPTEYYDYCYSSEDESIDSLRLHLLEIFDTAPYLLQQKAREAREFILNNKTPKQQVKKILLLLNSKQ